MGLMNAGKGRRVRWEGGSTVIALRLPLELLADFDAAIPPKPHACGGDC